MSRARGGRVVCVAALSVALTACETGSISDAPGLAITLEAQPASGLVGDTVVFRFTAEGPQLVGITIDFGDGGSEAIAASGARTAAGNVRHAYATAGEFEAVASVTSGQDRIAMAQTIVSIRVGSPHPGRLP